MKGKPNFSSRFLFSKNMYKRYGFTLKSGRKHHKKSPFCTRLLFLCI